MDHELLFILCLDKKRHELSANVVKVIHTKKRNRSIVCKSSKASLKACESRITVSLLENAIPQEIMGCDGADVEHWMRGTSL